MLNAELLQLFIYCLLKANHDDNDIIWNGKFLTVKRGSFLTGLLTLSKALKQKQTSTYNRLKILEQLGYISLKSENKFSIVTILKYNTYQILGNFIGKQPENKWKTNGKQPETNKKDKKDKKDKNRGFIPPSQQEVKDFFVLKGYRDDIAIRAYEYYEAGNWHDVKGNKIKNWKQKMIAVWMRDENKLPPPPDPNQPPPFQRKEFEFSL